MKKNYRDLIISVLANAKKAMLPEEIAFKSGIGAGDLTDFINELNKMEKEKIVFSTKKGKYGMDKKSNLITATIVSMHRAFSFAKPEDGEDYFIANRNLNGALPGDVVSINVKKDKRGTEGEVVKIEKRSEHEYYGKVVEGKNYYDFECTNAIRYPLPIDFSAKRRSKLKLNDKVKVKLIQHTRGRANEYFAKIIKIYGNADTAKVCADSIIEMAEIPNIFPPVVKAQAKIINEKGIREIDYINRVDLRNENIFTIDGADAKDLDDAVSIEKLKGGGWKLGVHIADVSHYVTENSPIDKEAFSRGTSVYFADRVIPMLPEELSNGLCSLNGGVDRLAFSAYIALDENGIIRDFNFFKSIINSKVRGVYSEVNSILDKTADEALSEKYSIVKDVIFEMQKCANKLKVNAKQRGYLEIETTESKIMLDENGVACDVVERQRGESEEMIEQFMICANVASAMFAEQKHLPFIFRIHEKPKPERILNLKETAEMFGFDGKNISTDSTPSDLAKLLSASKNSVYSKIISLETLRTMSKAKYSPECLGHFGLSLTHYSHFTSPIRRYPDLSIHRILSAYLETKNAKEVEFRFNKFVVNSSKDSTACEIRAMTAERNCEDCYKAEYIKKFIGEEFEGTISSVVSHGIYVELENSVEGMIRPDDLAGGEFHYDGKCSYVADKGELKYTIGDKIKITVVSADVSNGRIDFTM